MEKKIVGHWQDPESQEKTICRIKILSLPKINVEPSVNSTEKKFNSTEQKRQTIKFLRKLCKLSSLPL
jgi:hypothetical protein